MKRTIKLRALACAVLAVAAPNVFASGYAVVEFALKPTIPHGAYTSSFPGAIAADGRTIINAVTVSKDDRAYMGGELCNASGDVCQHLAPKDHEAYYLAATSDFSRVAGVAKDDESVEWAVRSKGGAPEYLLPNARANSINKKGVVVGEDGAGNAYRYTNMEIVLPPLAGPFNYANSINDNGVVAGEGSTEEGEARAVIWDKAGAVHALQPGMPNGVGHWSSARFITADGIVYGTSTLHQGTMAPHAVRFTNKGKAISLGALGTDADGNSSSASSANIHGVVVGNSTNLPTDGSAQAVLFANGSVTELATLVPQAARDKYRLGYATRINDAGQILVIGWRNDTGDQVALRLDPQP